MMDSVVLAVGIGLIAGTHIATWGMFKDAPHEGFAWRRYGRAILLGGAIAAVTEGATGFPVRSIGGALVFFGIVYALERAVEEIYKTFLREQDQAKYFIPMQFHIKGRIVESRGVRRAVAAACVTGGVVAIVGLRTAERLLSDWPQVAAILLVGGVGGWISAIGGAAKDAPIEGFETLKFFRSPLIATGWALLLAHLADDYVSIALGAIGFTVATIETWKTFFFPGRPRGKFAGKPVLFPAVLRWRLRIVPVYVAIWIALLTGFILALGDTRGGLIGRHHGAVDSVTGSVPVGSFVVPTTATFRGWRIS